MNCVLFQTFTRLHHRAFLSSRHLSHCVYVLSLTFAHSSVLVPFCSPPLSSSLVSGKEMLLTRVWAVWPPIVTSDGKWPSQNSGEDLDMGRQTTAVSPHAGFRDSSMHTAAAKLVLGPELALVDVHCGQRELPYSTMLLAASLSLLSPPVEAGPNRCMCTTLQFLLGHWTTRKITATSHHNHQTDPVKHNSQPTCDCT